MSVREIVLYPSDVLTTEGRDVDVVDDDVRAFIDDLADTMYQANGVGLAAQQVGDTRRICVLDISEGDERDTREGLVALVNPRVVEKSGRLTWEEGCLSFPDLFDKVDRASWVRVEALNRDGEPFSMEGKQLLAVVLQHEIDHLDGILFLDRMEDMRHLAYLEEFHRYWNSAD